jgi:aryl sulfotransferase
MQTMPSPSRPDLRLRLLETTLRAIQGTQRGLIGAQIHLRRKIAFDYRFQRRPDDVFISTFPKSGTTLVQMIVHQLRGDGSMDIPHINAVVPWLETEVFSGNYRFLDALPSPRVFKTHLRRQFLPPDGRFIYIYRDVREVFVSGYHQQCRVMGQRIPFELYARQFEQAPPHNGNWFQHLESWWPHRYDRNVLFLTFAEMTADLAGTVRRVAAFCGLPLDESQMPRILERCGIEYMRRHNAKFDPRLYQIDPGLETFIRRGKTGRWAEELPAVHRAKLEQQAQELARRLGGGGAEDPFAYLGRSARPATGPRAVPKPAERLRATGTEG